MVSILHDSEYIYRVDGEGATILEVYEALENFFDNEPDFEGLPFSAETPAEYTIARIGVRPKWYQPIMLLKWIFGKRSYGFTIDLECIDYEDES